MYAGGRTVYAGRSGYYVRGGYGYGYRGYSVVAPVHFYHPYYAFRPYYSVGFGLWAGYPFAYANPFYYPYYPAYPYGYYPYGGVTGGVTVGPNGYPPYGAAYPSAGYPPASNAPSASNYPAEQPQQQGEPGSISVQSGQANSGGLSFEITPNTAQLFVDGALVGTVGQFTPTSQPLGLVAGRHKIEVRASGYQTMTFDVDIIAGQVIPYQGSMER